MSLTSHIKASCCSCGHEAELEIYKSINTSDDPQLKARVADGSLFVWECPECGQANLLKYETLYHDPKEKVMVWLIPAGDLPEAQMQAIAYHARAMGGYKLRRVSDVSSLMEKVLIFEAGLDDVVIEMCKFVTRSEMAAKAPEERRAEIMSLPMHFYRKGEQGGEECLTLTFPDNGRMAGCNIGLNVYEDCLAILQRNPSIKAEEGFAKVDSDWLTSLLG